MARSELESVRAVDGPCVPNCCRVLRLHGRSLPRFSEQREFNKPNDDRVLHVVAKCAQAVMEELAAIVTAYGLSDEYSFVFK
uniref:Probable tRNA(His) guanylyltransferase n=1 Tax=Melopsittacus undulatus TaxID=13146 RepID=A0A8C6IQH0_MELUD